MPRIVCDPAKRISKDCGRFLEGHFALIEIGSSFLGIPLKSQNHSSLLRDYDTGVRLTAWA